MAKYLLRGMFVAMLIGWVGMIPVAQEAPTDPNPTGSVTDDEVNEVAARMYCPICEMEPLHTCRATTCIEWRQEIREQLAEGRTSDEIVTYFVDFYGDRVVGIPEDDGLRLLSLAGPIAVTILAIIVGFWTFNRWQQRNNELITPSSAPIPETPDNETGYDEYRSRLENDLRK